MYSKLYESKMPLNIKLSEFTYNGISKLPYLNPYLSNYDKDYQSLNQNLGRWITPDTNLLYVFSAYVKNHAYKAKYSYTKNPELIKEYLKYMLDGSLTMYGFNIIPEPEPSQSLDIKKSLLETRKSIGGLEAILYWGDLDQYIKRNSSVVLNYDDSLALNNFPSSLINFIYSVILNSPLGGHIYIDFLRTLSTAKMREWSLIEKATLVTNPSLPSYYKIIDNVATEKEKFANLVNKITDFNSKVLKINSNMPSSFYSNNYEKVPKFTTLLHTLIGTYQLLNILLKEKYLAVGGNENDIPAIQAVLPSGGTVSKEQIKSDVVVASAKREVSKIQVPKNSGGVKKVSKFVALRGIVGGDMGTKDIVESRVKSQEVANMQVSLTLALLLTSRKTVKDLLLGETDNRIISEVEKLNKITLGELKKGTKVEIDSKLNDGIFGFRTRKMVQTFKNFANKSIMIPTEYKIKSVDNAVVDSETKRAIYYILDKYLYPASELANKPLEITKAEPKKADFPILGADSKIKITPNTTIEDLSKKIENGITGLEKE